MPEYEEGGLIIRLFKDDDLHSGGSLCNYCGKIMPVCWDVVCYKCNRTFCYAHSKNINGYWYCIECAVVYEACGGSVL